MNLEAMIYQSRLRYIDGQLREMSFPLQHFTADPSVPWQVSLAKAKAALQEARNQVQAALESIEPTPENEQNRTPELFPDLSEFGRKPD